MAAGMSITERSDIEPRETIELGGVESESTDNPTGTLRPAGSGHSDYQRREIQGTTGQLAQWRQANARQVPSPSLSGDLGQRITEALALDNIARPFGGVRRMLEAQLADSSERTSDALLADALDAASRKERISETLLADLVEVERKSERASAVESAIVTLNRTLAHRNTERLAEVAEELAELVRAELETVLSEASRTFGALTDAGAETAEAAMRAGLSEQWLASTELPSRWRQAQAARFWLAHASAVGYGDHTVGEFLMRPDRLARAGLSTEFAEWWCGQFDDPRGQITIDELTPAESVLRQWVSLTEKRRPRPVV